MQKSDHVVQISMSVVELNFCGAKLGIKTARFKFLSKKQGDKLKNTEFDFQHFKSKKQQKWGTRFSGTKKSPEKAHISGEDKVSKKIN
jgi:hypothetical protein